MSLPVGFPGVEPSVDRASVHTGAGGDRGHRRGRVLGEQVRPGGQDLVDVAGGISSHGHRSSPGDPQRAAAAIYQVVISDRPRHWVGLGSDAYRRIAAKLEMLWGEFDAGRLLHRLPGSGPAVL
jgi:hypothetical protein